MNEADARLLAKAIVDEVASRLIPYQSAMNDENMGFDELKNFQRSLEDEDTIPSIEGIPEWVQSGLAGRSLDNGIEATVIYSEGGYEANLGFRNGPFTANVNVSEQDKAMYAEWKEGQMRLAGGLSRRHGGFIGVSYFVPLQKS